MKTQTIINVKMCGWLIFCLFSLIVATTAFAGTMSTLYNFIGGGTSGSYPHGGFILDGSTLYGMTALGGDSDRGVVFSIGTDGTNFTLLHEFAGGGSDGNEPHGTLVLNGSTLYGMTYYGGDSNYGVIFSIGTNGTGFTLLHEFTGGASDGREPNGSLVLSGSTLYGMAIYGGDSNYGVIFSIETNGTGFTLLHEFAGGGDDGREPFGSLVLSGSTLYGMTPNGGDSNYGVIFSIETNGTGFTLLHEFTGGASDGRYPYSSLLLSGSTLYGMTYEGGDSNSGVIFSIGTNGSGYTLLREFAGGSSDGMYPHGDLRMIDLKLYGLTYQGGTSDAGIFFSIDPDGSNFALLHSFTGYPYYNSFVTFGPNAIYGPTYWGGSSDIGSIFKWSDLSLPVELASFSAAYEQNAVTLNWSTESEVNAIGFIIDRKSVNETDWQQIASYKTNSELDCKNNQIGNTNYSYTDSTAQPGKAYTYRLSNIDLQGYVTVLKEVIVTTTGVTQQIGVGLPERTELLAAFPNPFNPKTEISYNLATDVVVNLSVYNIAGQEVQRIIVNEFKSAGVYQTSWDGQNNNSVNVPSGTYIIRMRAGDVVQTQKVVLMR